MLWSSFGRKVSDHVGDTAGKPPGVADRKEILQAVPQADRSLNAGKIELPGVVEGAVVLPGTVGQETPVPWSGQ